MLFASDFSGLAIVVLGVPILLVGLVFVSFYPSSRGHWSGPVLAAPATLLGALFILLVAATPERKLVLPWLISATPLLFGLASIALWSSQRKQ